MEQQRSISFSVDVPETSEAELIAEYAVYTPTQHINFTGCRMFRTPPATYIEYVYTFRDEAIAQMERWINDGFDIREPGWLSGNVRMEINAKEILPDGVIQFRHLTTINFPLEVPDEMMLKASLFVPGHADDPEELVTLERITK